MAFYGVTRTASNLNTAADSITIVAGSKALRVYVVSVGGMGTSSAANEIAIARSTSGATPGGGVTPAPYVTSSPAATFAAYTTWVTQPTIGAVLERLTVNANGGKDKFIALPGGEVEVPASGQLSLRSTSGVSSVTFALQIEEIG